MLAAPRADNGDLVSALALQLTDQVEIEFVGASKFKMRHKKQQARALLGESVDERQVGRGGAGQLRTGNIDLRKFALPQVGVTLLEARAKLLGLVLLHHVVPMLAARVATAIPVEKFGNGAAPHAARGALEPEIPIFKPAANSGFVTTHGLVDGLADHARGGDQILVEEFIAAMKTVAPEILHGAETHRVTGSEGDLRMRM